MAVSNEAVLYREVKAWIAQQEAFEAEHKTPAPLTHAQRKALEALCPPVSSPTPPTVGDVNYVGLLQEYRQKHPRMGDIVYTEEASGVLAGGTTGRVCRVAITESPAARGTGPGSDPGMSPIKSFPAAGGYGLVEDTGRPPAFSTKKAAKHFAAKCALDWLVDRGLMSPYSAPGGAGAAAAAAAGSAGVGTLKRASAPLCTTANAASPPAKRQSMARAAPPTPDGGGSGSDSAPEDAPPVTDGKATADSSSPAVAAAAAPYRPATELVVGLCRDLNIPPPRYQLDPSAAGGTLDGFAAFEDYGDEELVALRAGSAVKGVAGREGARQAVAEKLLVLLRKIEADRDEQLRAAMEDSDGDTDGVAV